jgi:SAM-dependent methyltransferase
MTAAHGDGEFDAYADHYGEELARGTSLSGESSEYFARGRVAWLARRLHDIGFAPTRVMDFGCGTGATVSALLDILAPSSVVGVDVSAKSVERARRSGRYARVSLQKDLAPAGDVDVVYCNGVFHHIPPPERPAALRYVRGCLRPGGVFALWENNPWNPGTQIVMSRIAFDRDAVKLSAPHARRICRDAGFEIVSTDFQFVFPRMLGLLRFMEPGLSRLPIGAQYMVLLRKPD